MITTPLNLYLQNNWITVLTLQLENETLTKISIMDIHHSNNCNMVQNDVITLHNNDSDCLNNWDSVLTFSA